jgi:hypothetical protein
MKYENEFTAYINNVGAVKVSNLCHFCFPENNFINYSLSLLDDKTDQFESDKNFHTIEVIQ